jgi:four helix bundle protein
VEFGIMKENVILVKSKAYAIRIVKLSKYMKRQHHEFVLSQQVLRSGTSIGANVAESEYAISRKEFLSKLYIALKECGETLYWLDVIYRSSYITDRMYVSMQADCMELMRILQSITKSTKENM